MTIVDPTATWIEPSVEIEPDVTIHPFIVLRGRTRIGAGAEIHAHTVAVDAEIGKRRDRRALLLPSPRNGPRRVFEGRHLRGDQELADRDRTKVPHLSYIGDADIGEDTNIGAGAITANLAHRPGEPKQRTTIGSNVRTAIHNGFVAPVEVGDGAWIAAGSVITKDVPARRARRRARTPGEQGGVCSRGSGTSELVLPGSRGARARDAGRSPATGSSAGRRSG